MPSRALPPDCRTGLRRALARSQHKRGMQLAAQGTVNKVLGESETIKGPEQIQRRELLRAGRHSPGKVPLCFGRAAGRKAGLQRPGWAGQVRSLPCPPPFPFSGPAVLALHSSHAHFRDAHGERASSFGGSHTVASSASCPDPGSLTEGPGRVFCSPLCPPARHSARSPAWLVPTQSDWSLARVLQGCQKRYRESTVPGESQLDS